VPKRIPKKPGGLSDSSPETDPILALRGLGKEVWRELGSGENFIRELRSNWYGNDPKATPRRRSRRRKS